jgi:hypothetical protein
LSAQRPPETFPEALGEQSSSTSSPRVASSPTRLSSRYSVPLQFTTNVSNPVPRFGTSTPCPGCSQSVSPMERGVVPGPQGQRWHSSCLVCGGKQTKGRGGRRVNGQPGCGKQLDSSAKRDTGGGVWCRDCLVCTFYLCSGDCKLIVDLVLAASSTRATLFSSFSDALISIEA